ncbi:MAG: carboxypeptidase-like regulatory domain-containing protein, partial [Gemmatimonadales bacterium]
MLATVSAMLRHGLVVLATFMLAVVFPSPIMAQGSGTVTGLVTRAGEGSPLPSVSVTVQSTGLSTITGPDGRYTLRRVPEGAQTIVFRWLGYKPMEIGTTVEADRTVTVYAAMEPVPVALTEMVVST